MGKHSKSNTDRETTVSKEKIQVPVNPDIKRMVSEAVEGFKQKYLAEINALKIEILELKKSQNFISCQYEDLKTEHNKLLLSNKNQDIEIKSLKDHSMELTDKVLQDTEKIDAVEQYGRRQNLEMVGVPMEEGEDTNKIVIEVAKLLQVELTPDQISTSHRLPTKRKQSSNELHPSPPIIVRFISRDIRNRIYGLRKLTRNVDLESFSVEGTQRLFINENLTYHRKQLFWKTKQKAKNAGYRFFWTTNGNIFVRKTENSEATQIKSENDLLSIT